MARAKLERKSISGTMMALLLIGALALAFGIQPAGAQVGVVETYKLSNIPRRMHGDENYLYYTVQNGGTYRINKATGVEEFFSDKGHDLIWVEGDYVYVGEGYELHRSGTNDIYKYDKDGNLIWHVHPTYSGPWGGATFQFGVGKYYIYAVAGPYAYGAISKDDGSILWVSAGGVTRYPDTVMADLKNEVVVETGWWSTNTIQRVSKVDGNLIWRRRGPSAEMGEVTDPVDITDDAIWVRWMKGTYPYQYFYALAKWDRDTGALIEAFPDKPYDRIYHLGPEGSLIFDYPDEVGNALVWNPDARELSKVNSQTWEVYWTTDLGYPLDYVHHRPFIDGPFIYLTDLQDPTTIYQFQWRTPSAIPVTIDIDPDTLNLKSNGQWITAYITLPEGYNVTDIDTGTVEIDGISAAWADIQSGVYMAKFDRATIQSSFTNEPDYDSAPKFYELTLTVTGEVAGTQFIGNDMITVIKK